MNLSHLIGAQDDLDKVTQMAYRQVVEYGMSPVIGHISLPYKRPSDPARRMYSDKLARMIDKVHSHANTHTILHVAGHSGRIDI